MPSLSVDTSGPARAMGLQVRPFRALTYAQHDADQLARVSSPAYDLVTAEGRRRLAAADPHNVVRLILPGADGEATGSTDATVTPGAPATAALAAATLARWRADGILVDDDVEAVWLYRMRSAQGAETTGWLAAVTVPAAGSTAVVPHEDTYAPAVEGRRLLLAATATDLEPIVLAHDPQPEVAGLADQVAVRAPDVVVEDPDGVRHSLWRVPDPELVRRLTAGWAGTGAVIADGHHRYAAARAHASSGAAGSGAVLALLTPTGPGGLRVRAIHRVVPALDLDTAADLAAGGFTVDPVHTDDVVGTARHWVDQPQCGCFLLTDGRRVLQLTSPTTAVRARVPAEAPASWRSLDVVLAHHGLIAGLWGRPDDPEQLLIAHDAEEAVRLAIDHAGVALLLRSPTPADVAAVARAGARMPRKSTLFVPKPRTGLVMRPL